MADIYARMSKIAFVLLAAVILLTGCAGAAPMVPEPETEQVLQEQEQSQAKKETALLPLEQSREENVESSSGEDTGQISVEEMEEWIFQSPYARAYYDYLQEYIASCTPAEKRLLRLSLVFIDEDDVPELLIFPDNSHAAGVEVYSYTRDRVVELGEFGSFGKMQYVERGGMIFDHFMGQGEAYTYFFRIEGGEARQVSYLHSWPDNSRYLETGEYMEFYEIDERSVTEDVYQAKWEELYDSQEYVLIGYEDGIPLNETELLPALAQAIENLLWKGDSPQILGQVSEQTKALKAYAKTLAEYAENEYTQQVRFSLIYLDEDDTPELVIFMGDTHMDGANLYIYGQGQSVYVGIFGQWGAAIYQEKKGIIFHEYDQGGHGFSGVYQIDGAEETLLREFEYEQLEFEDGPEEVACIYRVDGREVSKEEYSESLESWTDGYRTIAYDMCIPVKCADIESALKQELQALILTRYDILRQNIRIKSGMDDDSILMMNHDDYDRDGRCEAFVFCGESYEEYDKQLFEGALWFVGAEQCTLLREERYRMIDGQMKLGPNQKYLYLYSDMVFTANISDLWTVENGEPVESRFSRTGMVIYREEYCKERRNLFEIIKDSYDNLYDVTDEIWMGHTYKPYFYYYDWTTNQIERDESEIISAKELERLCGFDMAGEVETEGYEITDIIKWKQSNIVTVNYTIPADEDDPYPVIIFENIIWDCNANDYWRSEERCVTSWRDAGEGGSFHR